MQGFGGTNALCGAAQSALLLKWRGGEDDPSFPLNAEIKSAQIVAIVKVCEFWACKSGFQMS